MDYHRMVLKSTLRVSFLDAQFPIVGSMLQTLIVLKKNIKLKAKFVLTYKIKYFFTKTKLAN